MFQKTIVACAFFITTSFLLPTALHAQSRVVATIDGNEVDTVIIMDAAHRSNTKWVENVEGEDARNTLLIIDGNIYRFDAAGYAAYKKIRDRIKNSRWIKDEKSKSEIKKILIVETE